MVTSLLVPVEERRDEPLIRPEGLGPRREQAAALVGELVDPLAGPGRVVAPLGGDEAVLLEGTQHAVEVAHVDPLLARQLGKLLEQVVAVRRALSQQEEERRLAEPLDARAHRPLAGPDAAARTASAKPASPHRQPTCKTHMFGDDSTRPALRASRRSLAIVARCASRATRWRARARSASGRC